ncbi:MAG: DNA-3-methyladenine glycosylase 2 family protein [Anaerolineae bacterium]
MLEPLPPFRLDLTVWALRRRPDNLMDRWDGRTYRRALLAGGAPMEVAVTQVDGAPTPRLCVTVTGNAVLPDVREHVVATLQRLLGTQVDLQGFYGFSAADALLEPLAGQFRGFKPPRFATLFETLVNAISCQQLTLTMGIRLLNRLTEAFGAALETETGTVYAFPRPEDLADAGIEELRRMSFSYAKARYLTGLARAIVDGQIDLEQIARLGDQEAVARLCELKGVGRWTAEYFLLRGLGRTHIFPADDVGARNHLQRWLDLPGALTYDTTAAAVRRWDGYGGLVYFHMLMKSLAEKGLISEREQPC